MRALITEQKEKYSWDFVFLGANQDAVLTGASLGIDADSSLTYAADADGVAGASESLHRYMSSVRKKDKLGFSSAERSRAGGTDRN